MDIKTIIDQCQYCESFNEEKCTECIHYIQSFPTRSCGRFKRKPIILSEEILKSDEFIEAASDYCRSIGWTEPD